MKTEAEAGQMRPQAQTRQGRQGLRKRALRHGARSPRRLWRERGPADTLLWDLRPPDCERISVGGFKPPRLR